MITIPRHASILIALVLTLLILLSWGSLYHQEQDPENLTVVESLQTATDPIYDKLMIEGFTIKKQNSEGQLLTISAKQLIHRKRKSQFFVYQNLKEIYLRDTQINFSPPLNPAQKKRLEIHGRDNNIYSGQELDPAQKKRLEIPFELIGKSFESFGSHIKPSIDEFWSDDSDIDLDIVSRIVFDRLLMKIALPDKKQISIQSDIALVPTGFHHLVFTGNVRIESGTGQAVVASQAVWSCKDDGFFFPNGHILENRQDNDPAFYDVIHSGALSRRNPTLIIDYADPLETKENELQEHIAKRMPAYGRLIFGLPPMP